MNPPTRVEAAVIGHLSVDTTLNVSTQALDGATRAAVDNSAADCSRLFTNRAEWKR
jgi:hypothetical protein